MLRSRHTGPRRCDRKLPFAWAGWAASILLVWSSVATAAEPRDESERWVPAFGLYFDVHRQKVEGSVSTGLILGPPLTEGGCLNPTTGTRSGELCPSTRLDSPERILPESSGSDTSVTPLVGASLELLAPRLRNGFLRPRPFARVDLAAAFSFERNVAGTENPGTFQLPSGFRVGSGQDPALFRLPEVSIVGQGSRARYQIRRFVVSAGGGVALTFDAWQRRFRIKPSFEYLRQEVDLIGVVHRAVALRDPAGFGLDGFRLMSLTRVERQVQHGLGGGLELEVDTSRLGPFQTSVYAMGRLMGLIGDLDETLTATNEFGETASWTFEPDPLVYRAGVGFRLRWLPER